MKVVYEPKLLNISPDLTLDTKQITCVRVVTNPATGAKDPENERYILQVAIKGAGFVDVTGSDALTLLEDLDLNDSMNKGRFFDTETGKSWRK